MLNAIFTFIVVLVMTSPALAEQAYGDAARLPYGALNPALRGSDIENAYIKALQAKISDAQMSLIKEEDFFRLELMTEPLGIDLNDEAMQPLKHLLIRTWATCDASITMARVIWRLPRPYQVDAGIKDLASPNGGSTYDDSFPAPHAVMTHTLAGVLALVQADWRDTAFATAEGITYRRHIAGLHYQADTKAGRDVAFMLLGNLWRNADFRQDVNKAITAIMIDKNIKEMNNDAQKP